MFTVEQTEINYSKTFTRDTKNTEDIKEKSKNNEAKIDFIDENFEVAENNEESQDKQFEIAALVKQTEMNCNETFTRNPTSTENTKEKSKNNEPKIDFIDENEAINEMKETNSIDIMEAVMPSLAFVKGFTLWDQDIRTLRLTLYKKFEIMTTQLSHSLQSNNVHP